MNAVLVLCKKCGTGQVPLIPDEDGECPCVQCGARHNTDGELLVDEAERERIHERIRNNGNGNGEGAQYALKKMYKNLGDGSLPYGNGCSHYHDCETCPFDDCIATYRYPRMGARRAYFVMSSCQPFGTR